MKHTEDLNILVTNLTEVLEYFEIPHVKLCNASFRIAQSSFSQLMAGKGDCPTLRTINKISINLDKLLSDRSKCIITTGALLEKDLLDRILGRSTPPSDISITRHSSPKEILLRNLSEIIELNESSGYNCIVEKSIDVSLIADIAKNFSDVLALKDTDLRNKLLHQNITSILSILLELAENSPE